MPAEKYIKPGESAPNLAPLPEASMGAPASASPRALWQDWYALPKTPLIVRAALSGPVTEHEFDSLLGAAVMRRYSTWGLANRDARVIPLPLGLLGVVPVPRKARPWRLPVWACTSLKPSGAGLAAVCVGHAETLEGLLSELPDLNGTPVTWSLEDMGVPGGEALEVIRSNRPMPGFSGRFTPPYWFDWMAAGEGQHG